MALKLLISGVDYQVGLKMPLSDKLGLTVRAHEWSLASVCPDVCLEVACVLELFKAVVEGADKNFCFGFWSYDLFDMYELDTS